MIYVKCLIVITNKQDIGIIFYITIIFIGVQLHPEMSGRQLTL